MATLKTALADRIINFRFGGFDQGIETRALSQQGDDETVDVIQNADGTWSIKSPNGQHWLSIQPDGSLEARDAAGEPGAWEKFTREGNVLTELPKEGITRPLTSFAGSGLCGTRGAS
jgi:hypothetical protein